MVLEEALTSSALRRLFVAFCSRCVEDYAQPFDRKGHGRSADRSQARRWSGSETAGAQLSDWKGKRVVSTRMRYLPRFVARLALVHILARVACSLLPSSSQPFPALLRPSFFLAAFFRSLHESNDLSAF